MKNYFKLISCLIFLMLFQHVSASDKSSILISSIAPNCAAANETVVIAGNGFGARNAEIKINGQLAELLEATGHSAKFLVPSSISPGFTTATITNPGGHVGAIDFQVKGNEICDNGIDDDCDGTIDEIAECPLDNVQINLIKTSSNGQFSIDKSKLHITSIDFMSSEEDMPYTVNITQSISPTIGLSLTPNLDDSEFTYTVNVIDKYKQRIRATVPGEYEITTTATVTETGDTSSRTYKYKVLASDSPELFIPSPGVDFETKGHPMILRPNTVTSIAFGMGSASGSDYDQISGIRIFVPDLGIDMPLNDDGLGSDDDASDRVYASQFINIDTSNMTVGQCLSYYAIVSTPKGDITSKPGLDLCVSNLPASPFFIEEQYWIDGGGKSYARNAILVQFKKEVTEARIIEIIENINGEIVGGRPFTHSYTIQLNEIPSAENARNILSQKIRELNTYPEILNSGLVLGGNILSSYSNDLLYQTLTLQYLLGNIPTPGTSLSRADEAWYVAKGSERIAIIDSGVDKGHQDLNDKVISLEGFNFAELNFDTDDFHHHGSHVAGIAAAKSNNEIGMTGVSWQSEVVPIKIYPGDKGKGASIGTMVAAIYHAAENKKTKIINFSSGFEVGKISAQCRIDSIKYQILGQKDTPYSCINDNLDDLQAMIDICNAVSFATVERGKIFIAAAGNTDRTTLIYPAACSEAIAVAAIQVDSFGNPKRWEHFVPGTGSHYGSWIDIAAPGDEIMSTVPPLTCLKDFLAPQQFLVADACYDFINGYRRISGTSEAAPFVAGAASVILAKNPS